MTEYEKVSDKYKYIKLLGSGSFGEVYLLQDIVTNEMYAAKLENKDKKSRLKNEYNIYVKLKNKGLTNGIAKVYDYIETNKKNIMVMELLGKDLDELHKKYNNKFDIGTVLKFGIEIIGLLEKLHNNGFIHRDIKPNNFSLGYNADNELYILDFGLSKQYINKSKHISYKIEKELVGTARYASINVHDGIEPSRRDDLESVGYMLIYFIKSKLPWQGLQEKKGENKIKTIGDAKRWTSLTRLCDNLPVCFMEYIKYCRNLSFTETPDYEYLRQIFMDDAKKLNVELNYCWNK
jgi:serine/threonine protein kinase